MLMRALDELEEKYGRLPSILSARADYTDDVNTGFPVSSDAAGNLTQDRLDRQMEYDQQNRLERVKIGGVTVAQYRYNALGQRTHKITGTGTTTFLYDPSGQLLGETLHDASGQPQSSQFYVWLDDLPLGGIGVTYGANGSVASSEPFFLHVDHLGTPRLATNANQQTVWTWVSDAYGMGAASGSLTVNLRFPGQYFDQETGLHYNYFRDYNPQTGRYVESDPIGLNGGLNTFGYVNGDPLSLIDPEAHNGVRPNRRGSMAAPPGQPLINLQVNLLSTQIRRLDPAFQYQTVRSSSSRYNQSDIKILQQYLSNARNAGYCGIGASSGNYSSLSPNFIVTPGGTAYPVPQGAMGPRPVINQSGNITGAAFIGGNGGANGQVTTVRIMNATQPKGSSPGYPNGYMRYTNSSSPRPQGVDPTTGKTVPNSSGHYPID